MLPIIERYAAKQSHKTTTFVAGLRTEGIVAPFVLDGSINRLTFETYIDKKLVPELRRGDIVMDNLSSHKGPAVRAMIKAADAACCTCRRTRRTSIRSKTPSQS